MIMEDEDGVGLVMTDAWPCDDRAFLQISGFH